MCSVDISYWLSSILIAERITYLLDLTTSNNKTVRPPYLGDFNSYLDYIESYTSD